MPSGLIAAAATGPWCNKADTDLVTPQEGQGRWVTDLNTHKVTPLADEFPLQL